MSFTGEIKNGVVVLDTGSVLPEGTRVKVEPLDHPDESAIRESWNRLIGMAEGLPPDLAKNHDHYLHGRPKK